MLIYQTNTLYSDCPFIEICHCNTSLNQVICDGNLGNQSEENFPSFSYLPPVEDYFFSNFKEIQSNAFENTTFLSNNSITIHLINITTINTDAFSSTMIISENSTLSIYIEHPNDLPSLTLNTHAFNHDRIDRIHFFNINSFNEQLIFDTHCFGPILQINELIFEQSNIAGFYSSGQESADIQNLYIRECPTLKQLTAQTFPQILGSTKTLEISGTGLEFIDSHALEAWSIILRELVIKNNLKLKDFSSNFIDGVLMELDTFDLSNNSITILDENYDWFAYSYTKYLILKYQQQLDLFLKSNILKTLGLLKTIDFSEGFISNNDDDIMQDYVPDMPYLTSINVSFTNLTENMVIDLLTHLSNSASQIIEVSLLGHILNDTNFCSYFQVFRKSPNLIHLELDETHECNCVVDLFFDDEHIDMYLNDSLILPICLLNTTRARCDIQSQLTLSKCSFGNGNSDPNTSGDIGSYAFIGIMAGLAVVLIALLAVGSRVVYRTRKGRRMTILDMEDPVDSPSSTSIEQPIVIEESIENISSDNMEERLETSF